MLSGDLARVSLTQSPETISKHRLQLNKVRFVFPGGCLAGIIAAGFENPKNMPGLKLPPGQGPLRFAIAVSGFRSRDPVHQLLFKQPVQTPVLHVLGRADQIVDLERSQTLVDVCANSRVELHDGGHSVPSQ